MPLGRLLRGDAIVVEPGGGHRRFHVADGLLICRDSGFEIGDALTSLVGVTLVLAPFGFAALAVVVRLDGRGR